MSISVRYSPSMCVDFLNISNDTFPVAAGKDKDLFVGENRKCTLTIPNGKTIQFRDVVVLGELIIQSSNPENTSVKSHFVVRSIFNASVFSAKNIQIKSDYIYIAKNRKAFQDMLQSDFIEWLTFQGESTKKIGLKSILV